MITGQQVYTVSGRVAKIIIGVVLASLLLGAVGICIIFESPTVQQPLDMLKLEAENGTLQDQLAAARSSLTQAEAAIDEASRALDNYRHPQAQADAAPASIEAAHSHLLDAKRSLEASR